MWRHYPFCSVSSPIVSRLFRCRPSAIPRLIVSVVVDSVKEMNAFWFIAHISQEIREALSPAFANSDSTSTAIFVACGARKITALAHASPRSIFRRCPTTMSSVSMNETAKVMTVNKTKQSPFNPAAISVRSRGYFGWPTTATLTNAERYVHA